MAKNDFRVASIFNIIIRICMKNVEFCRKTLSFYPKDVCLFVCFEKEFNQQVCLIKYAENEMSNSTSHKKKEKREEQKHNPTSKTFLKLYSTLFLNHF